jgi:hypothetical protein
MFCLKRVLTGLGSVMVGDRLHKREYA